MKAILVIDIFEDVGKYHADIYREDEKGNGEMIASYLPMKPMPLKNIWDKKDFADGWNACLERLEK